MGILLLLCVVHSALTQRARVPVPHPNGRLSSCESTVLSIRVATVFIFMRFIAPRASYFFLLVQAKVPEGIHNQKEGHPTTCPDGFPARFVILGAPGTRANINPFALICPLGYRHPSAQSQNDSSARLRLRGLKSPPLCIFTTLMAVAY